MCSTTESNVNNGNGAEIQTVQSGTVTKRPT